MLRIKNIPIYFSLLSLPSLLFLFTLFISFQPKADPPLAEFSLIKKPPSIRGTKFNLTKRLHPEYPVRTWRIRSPGPNLGACRDRSTA